MARTNSHTTVTNPRPAPRPPTHAKPRVDAQVLEDLAAREAELARREAELARAQEEIVARAIQRSEKYPEFFFLNLGTGKPRFLKWTDAEWIAANIQTIRNARR